MDIEFVVEGDLPTVLGQLVLQYDSDEKRKVLMNSLLVLLVEQGTTLDQLLVLLLPFLEDREVATKKCAAKILIETLRRTRDLPCPAEQTEECLRRLLPRATDVPISGQIIHAIHHVVQVSKELTSGCCVLLLDLFNNEKFHPTAHQQAVRLCCCRILLELTKKCNQTVCETMLSQTNFIRTVMDSTYEEKDPRNIRVVFLLYEWVCTNMHRECLKPFTEQLYDSLESYYPIDFVGDDEDEQTVSVDELAQRLDWCLTHPLFSTFCLNTLTSKMGSPPIKQFIPTLHLFILRNYNEKDALARVVTILRRVLQTQFLEDVESHLPLIDCIECLVQFGYRQLEWPVIDLELERFLTPVLSAAIDQRLLSMHAGFSLNLIRVLAANFKSSKFVGYFIVNRFLAEIDRIEASNQGRIEVLLGLIVAAFNNQQRLPQRISIALQQRLELIYGYSCESDQRALKILVLKILMSMPNVTIAHPILRNVVEMLADSTVDVMLRKSLVDFVNSVPDQSIQQEVSKYMSGLLHSLTITEDDAQVAAYGLVWNKNYKQINELLHRQPLNRTVLGCFMEQLQKFPSERAVDLLLNLDFEQLPEDTLRQFQSVVENAHAKDADGETSERVILKLQDAVQNGLSGTLYVWCGWKSALRSLGVIPEQLYAKLLRQLEGQGQPRTSLNFLLLEELLSVLESPHIPVPAEVADLVTISRMRRLNLPLILSLRHSLQHNDRACERLLNRISQSSKHDYPTLRQLLAQHILPVLLNHAEHSHHQREFFTLLKSIPLCQLRTINERILRVILLQLNQLTGNFELLQLCLDILVQFQDQIGDDKLEGILPVLLGQLSAKTAAPTTVLLACTKLLHFMSGCTFALRHHKAVITALKPLLSHRKRKVRQLVAASLNRWYDL